MAKKKNKRIRLLNDAEIEDIYGLPQFDQSQRVHYFSLNSDEESELNELLFTHSKLHFILQLDTCGGRGCQRQYECGKHQFCKSKSV